MKREKKRAQQVKCWGQKRPGGAKAKSARIQCLSWLGIEAHPFGVTARGVRFRNWLSGFIDGEGSFQIQIAYSRGPKGKYNRPRFALALRDDDRAILEEIVGRIGIGTLTLAKAHNRGPYETRAQVRWEVGRRAHLVRLVQILEECPLRAKKARDFEIWKKAVALYQTDHDSAEMQRLRDELREVRAYPD